MQNACAIHIAGRWQLVFHASIEVIRTMRRSGMHNARAGIHGHVVGENSQNLALLPGQKWVTEEGIFQSFPLKAGHHWRFFEAAFFSCCLP